MIPMSFTRRHGLLVTLALVLLATLSACSSDDDNEGDMLSDSDTVSTTTIASEPTWVTGWGRATFANLTGFGEDPVLNNQTVRLIIRPTQSGERARLRFSNANSLEPVTFDEVWVGKQQQLDVVVPGTNQQVLFSATGSVTLGAGEVIVSDPVDLGVTAFENLSVSIFVAGEATVRDQHLQEFATSFLAPGNEAGNELSNSRFNFLAPGPTPFTEFTDMAWLTTLDVETTNPARVLVALGDSITDGTCSFVDTYSAYPDLLADRLFQDALSDGLNGPQISVINMGIAGNTVLSAEPLFGQPIQDRLQRDVLDLTGVTDVILWAGTNDLINVITDDQMAASTEDVIAGLTDVTTRMKDAGIRVIGVTILPRMWIQADQATGDLQAAMVNDWIKDSGTFDAVIDANEILRDPQNPTSFNPVYNCDNTHPNEAGYAKLVNSIDLDLFR